MEEILHQLVDTYHRTIYRCFLAPSQRWSQGPFRGEIILSLKHSSSVLADRLLVPPTCSIVTQPHPKMYFSKGITMNFLIQLDEWLTILAVLGSVNSLYWGQTHPSCNDWNPYNECINPYYKVDEVINRIRKQWEFRPHIQSYQAHQFACWLPPWNLTNWYPKWRHAWSRLDTFFQGYHHFWYPAVRFRGDRHPLLRARSSVESSNWTDNPPRGRKGRFWKIQNFAEKIVGHFLGRVEKMQKKNLFLKIPVVILGICCQRHPGFWSKNVFLPFFCLLKVGWFGSHGGGFLVG